jgi:hypothetical protein
MNEFLMKELGLLETFFISSRLLRNNYHIFNTQLGKFI